MRKWRSEVSVAREDAVRRLFAYVSGLDGFWGPPTYEPSASRICTVLRRCQTCFPATRQRDSVERALERRRRVSRWRVRWDSRSDCLGWRVSDVHVGGGKGVWCGKCVGDRRRSNRRRRRLTPAAKTAGKSRWVAYRPLSNAGEARGESSAVMVKMPSNLRSGYGIARVAEVLTRTLAGRLD